MRKSISIIATLLLCIVATALATSNGIFKPASTTVNGIDLTDAYIFCVDAGKESPVRYYTSTQGPIVAPKLTEGGKNYYYVPASENPTRFFVAPLSGGAIAAVKGGSTNLSTYPDGAYYYTSSLTAGTVYNVDIKPMDEVRCGTFTVTIDNPQNIRVQRRTSAYTRTYLASDFVGNKLTVKFAPGVETDWTISKDEGKRIFKTTVDGTPLTRADGIIFTSANSGSMTTYMPLVLNGSNHNVVITADYPNNRVPVKIGINPTKGSNDNNPTYLNQKITKVTVDGAVIDRSVWDTDNFSVANGATVNLTFDSQLRGTFELGSGYLNGKAQTSRSSYLIESYDASPAQQAISIDALVINPWRYTVKSSNFDKYELCFNYGIPEEITAATQTGTVSGSLSKAYVKPVYNSGYKIGSIKINGQPVEATSKDRYEFPLSQDMTIEVTPAPYTRDKKMKISADANSYGMDIILDPDGSMSERLTIAPGIQEISYNDGDLPIDVRLANPHVYVNDVITQPDADGYFLSSYTPGQVVKLFNRAASKVTITYETINGTVYHDGVSVASGKSYEVLQGTQIKVVPNAAASTYVLQTGANSFATKQADKSFVFYAQTNANVSLHPENPKVTVKLTGKDDANQPLYKRIRVTEGNNLLELTGESTTLTLPYYANKSTYDLTFTDPTGAFEISGISASPATGTSFDSDSQTITGVKDGMTLNVTATKPDKPYKVRVVVMPDKYSNDYTYSYDSATGQWKPDGDKAGASTMVCYHYSGFNEETASMAEAGMPMPEPQLFIGENSYYYQKMGVSYLFAYSDADLRSDDPARIVNRSYDSYLVAINGQYEHLGSYGGELQLIDPYNPKSVTCFLYPSNEDRLAVPSFEYDMAGDHDFYWSIDGSDFEKYEEGDYRFDYRYESRWNLSNSVVRLYNGSEIRIKPADGEKFKKVIYHGKTDMEVKPDANGIYTMRVFEHETDFDYYNPFSNPVRIEMFGDGVSVSVRTSEFLPYDIYFDSKTEMFDMLYNDYTTFTVGEKDSYTISCGSSNVMVTRVTDDEKGVDLPFDPRTATVSGVYDGIKMTVYVEPVNRDKTITVNHPSYSKAASAPVLYLGRGAAYQSTFSLYTGIGGKTSRPLAFSDMDLPFEFESSSEMDIYINDVKVPYNAATGYAFPADIEDGSVMYIKDKATGSNVTAANMTYEIDPDIAVDVMHDTRIVANESTTRLAPVGTTVKVTAKEGAANKFQYAVDYSINGGEFKAVPASGFGVAATNTNITVRVAKTYNNMTLNAGAGTDLSKLTITADGQTYTVAPGANTIKLPTHITSMTVATSEEGKFVDTIDGLTFDTETGVATDLKSGSFTVNVKEVERPMEVTVYVDTEDLTDGVLVLGNGKVIETGAKVEEGYNTINFSEEDLPIIYRVTEFADDMESGAGSALDESQLPTVYVNGEKLQYSMEHGGFVFPVEALTSGEAPVIKIYPPTPAGVEEVAPVKLTYLVEPGITFTATEDRVTEITEAGMRDVLPGTEVTLEAKADNGDNIYVEVDGQRIAATNGKYTFNIGQTDMTISVKFEKLDITLKSDAWNNIRISGAGLTYPMYDETSVLQFPQKTSDFRLSAAIEGKMITSVTDANGNPVQFDAKTGTLTGVKTGMTLNITTGDYARNLSLMVYLEETVEEAGQAQPVSHLILAPKTQVEKVVTLRKGYQSVTVAHNDLPLALTTLAGCNATVFLNNEQIEIVDGIYRFPTELPANPVVKIFIDRPEGIAKADVAYDFSSIRDYNITITHDNMPAAIDATKTHSLLPGTEIRFTVTPKTKLNAMATNAAPAFIVKVNGEEIEAQPDGSYMVKVNDDHIIRGLSIEVEQSGSPTAAIESVEADNNPADVYNLNGILILKAASAQDIANLPAGIYIVGGQKVMIGR